MKKYQKEIIGIYLFFISSFILMSLISHKIIGNNIMGPMGQWLSRTLITYMGVSSYVIPIVMSIYGYLYFFGKSKFSAAYFRFVIYLINISIWTCTFIGFLSNILGLEIIRHYSGIIGIFLSHILTASIGNIFSGIILFIYIVIIHMIFFQFSLLDILNKIKKIVFNLISDSINRIKTFRRKKDLIDDSEIEISNQVSNENMNPELLEDEFLDSANEDLNSDILSTDNQEDINIDSGIDRLDEDIHIEEEVEEERVDIDTDEARKKKYFKYNLPKSSLLNDSAEVGNKYSEAELHQKSEELMYALETFGVKGKVKRINQGPVITLFEIEPDEGVRVNKFINLSDDLSRIMKASKVRVIAPIPGTRFVGIEIPNESPSIVYLKNIITSESYNNLKSKMAIALGKTTSGQAFSIELNKMPHLLVAGATGSGKSVCINSIITSILYKAKPDEVKFILIDPKKVELSSYNSLKKYHLITAANLDEDVITKTENSTGILDSAINEMERRFELFSEVKVRNLDEYNNKRIKDSSLEVIPHIVIIIDELADLMMTSGRAIEDPITRLAQKARAIGIHLIVATQRPSVNVITGLIKSNFPARIAFQVSSKIDSRTIIDQNGAETLLGNGDMLFLPPGSATPIRIHGAFINLEEIESILSHISSQPIPDEVFLPEIKVASDNNDFSFDDRDELIIDAAKLVIQHQQASVSLLQRKFRIGYSRAGRIVDELESLGIVSGYSGSKARDVLVDESYLENIIK
tara:strand:+ start:6448 stop:8697 length:2250 start_codon:yes stop_codon:yes gene_type:complete